jgi:hypothetical protein
MAVKNKVRRDGNPFSHVARVRGTVRTKGQQL